MILKTFSGYPVNLKDPAPLVNNQIRGFIEEKNYQLKVHIKILEKLK